MNEWLRNTASSYLALSYNRTRQFPVSFQTDFEKCSVVSRWQWIRLITRLQVKVELHCGCCSCSSCHFTPTVKWFSTGYWWGQVKQQAYSSSLFVLWLHDVYPAPQRHGSLLWAVAWSHGGGQGLAAYWHPRCCPLNTLGERKAGSLLGWHCFESWESSSFTEGSRSGIFWLAAFFVRLTFSYRLLRSILLFIYIYAYKSKQTVQAGR